MITFVFEVFNSGTQLIFVLMGLVFLGLGLGMMVYPLWQRLKWPRVKARVVELRTEKVMTGVAEGGKSAPAGLLVFFAIIPLVFVGMGAYFAYDYFNLKSTGIQANAQIIRMDSSTDSEGDFTYAPVVEFQNRAGQTMQLKYRSSSSLGKDKFKAGDPVTVFYEEANPEDYVIDDFWYNMTMPIIVIGFGSVFLLVLSAAGGAGGNRSRNAHMTYYPVFEYITPDGRMVKAQPEDASYSLNGNMPQTEVFLSLKPEDYDSPVRSSRLLAIMGLVFAAPGVLILSQTVKGLEFGLPLFVAFFGGLAFIAFKMSKSIKPRELWESRAEFRKRMDEKLKFKKVKKNESGFRGKAMDTPSIYALQSQQDRQLIIWTPLYLLVVGGLCAGGWHFYNKQAQFEARALQGEAEVVDLISKTDSDGTVYYPKYRFQTARGETIEFKDNVGSNPPSARVGDRSPILYEEAYPGSAIVDRGWLNRLPSLIALVLGGWGLWGSVRGFVVALCRSSKNHNMKN